MLVIALYCMFYSPILHWQFISEQAPLKVRSPDDHGEEDGHAGRHMLRPAEQVQRSSTRTQAAAFGPYR